MAVEDEQIQTPAAEAALQDPGQTPAATEAAPEDLSLPAPQAAPLEELPVLTVRDTVIFPGALLPITVGRPSSVALVQALGENRTLAVISQLDPRVDRHGTVSESPRGAHRRRGAGEHPRAGGAPAERGGPVPADRGGDPQSFRRPP